MPSAPGPAPDAPRLLVAFIFTNVPMYIDGVKGTGPRVESAPHDQAPSAAARRRRTRASLSREPPRPRRRPSPAALDGLSRLALPLAEEGLPPDQVLALLDDVGSPATLATAGPRFFGFVIGGALPATVAASWLATAWDQNAGLRGTSPVAAALEDAALAWLSTSSACPRARGPASSLAPPRPT